MKALWVLHGNSGFRKLPCHRWLRLVPNSCIYHAKMYNTFHAYEEGKRLKYQYLQNSSIPTSHFQLSLPKLPIPTLQATHERYLQSQEVISTPEQFAMTKKYAQNFFNGLGIELQQSLLQQNDENYFYSSFIAEPWYDMYLRDRSSLVHNFNPFFAFQPDVDQFKDDPVRRTTNIIISSLRFLHSLRDEILKPEMYCLGSPPNETLHYYLTSMYKWATQCSYLLKAIPLDMSQYNNLFNSTRIPSIGKDRIETYSEARHMLMMKNGNFYVFDVLDPDYNLMTPEHILSCVEYIYKDETPPPETPIGILTAHDRDVWAGLRHSLFHTGRNSEKLRMIDSAAFNFVIDNDKVEMDPKKCFKTFLSGDATNRWFDKSFSIIMSADGVPALNFEHSWGDGVAVIRYFNEVANDISAKNLSAGCVSHDASHHVKRLDFEINPEIKAEVEAFIPVYAAARNAVDVEVLQSTNLGKRLCKQAKVSPDAAMQLGFQIAHNFLKGESASTYESCSTAMFKHGRTETLRPATMETQAICSALLKPENEWPSMSQLKDMIINCSKAHAKLTKEAATGKGFDRHLFVLRKICKEIGEPLPDFFTNEAYNKLNHFTLSTSTLPSAAISIGGFAPVVKNGLGIGYRILNDDIALVASCYPPDMDCKGFITCAEKAYNLIGEAIKCK